MPWKKTTPRTERLSLIALYQTRLWSMPALWTRVNISRKTGDKWLRRAAPEGVSGLQETRRAPLSCPHRLASAVAAGLLEAKQLRPSWGPRQSLPSRARHPPALEVPATSRAGERFRNAGRSRSKPRRRRPMSTGHSAPETGGRALRSPWRAPTRAIRWAARPDAPRSRGRPSPSPSVCSARRACLRPFAPITARPVPRRPSVAARR